MKIALVQTNPLIGDFARNIAEITAGIERAKAAGCGLAVFPELAVSGYPPQDLLDREAFVAAQDRALAELVARTRGIGVICGAATPHTAATGKVLHNSAVLFADGAVRTVVPKRLLPTYDVFDETRHFEPGRITGRCEFGGLRLGLTVCEDIWNDPAVFPRPLYNLDPVAEMVGEGPVDLLINIAASPFHIGKHKIKSAIFANLCRRYRLPLLYVNQVGGQDSLIFDGDSLAMAADGRIAAATERFCEDMVVVDSDTWQGERHRPGQEEETTDVYRALVMGTRDYVHKCGFRKGLLGLSGGVDSSLSAAIAVEALGAENVLGVAMPSPYTSEASIEDARQLAANLGIDFRLIPITTIFEAFKAALAPAFGDRPEDVTEQNIQARVRGTLLMALSNKLGHLLLSTGNKSEMAVGYCTLYGDMSGGLAVISDVPKGMVYRLAHHVNRHRELIPGRTISRPPSAELAPDQRDEDDLPPYEVLDPILAAYLEENRSAAEIAALGFAPEVVEDVIRRVMRNEYKRKQAPPGLKVTTRAFGHGWRYPTAKGFREEVPR